MTLFAVQGIVYYIILSSINVRSYKVYSKDIFADYLYEIK